VPLLNNVLNCGSTGTRWYHDVTARLKPAVIVIIAIFYIHVLVVENKENGWKSQRQFCYAEAGTCESSTSTYGVGSNNNCYEVLANGNHKSCTSDSSFMFDCMASNSYSYSNTVLHSEYDSSPRADYFLHSVGMVVLCCFILILSLLFDGKLNIFDFIPSEGEGAFYLPDGLNMEWVSTLLELVLLVLMVWSASVFCLMQPAFCTEEYSGSTARFLGTDDELSPFHRGGGGHGGGGGGPPPPPTGGSGVGTGTGTGTGGTGDAPSRDVCMEFVACGADVRSIIEPTDWAARFYGVFVFLMVAALLAVMVLRLLTTKAESRVHSELLELGLGVDSDEENMQLQLGTLQRPSGPASASASVSSSARTSSSTSSSPNNSSRYMAAADIHPESVESATGSGNESGHPNTTVNNDTSAGNGSPSRSSGRHDRTSSARTSLTDFADTLFARQTLVRKWEFHDISKIRRDTKLCAAIKEHGECTVCLATLLPASEAEEWDNPAVVRVPCGHWFHKECLTGWIVSGKSKSTKIQNNTCPVCRANLAAGRH